MKIKNLLKYLAEKLQYNHYEHHQDKLHHVTSIAEAEELMKKQIKEKYHSKKIINK